MESNEQTVEVQAESPEVVVESVETNDPVTGLVDDLFPEYAEVKDEEKEVEEAPAEEVKDEAPAEQSKEPVQEVAKLDAPAHWPQEMREKFDALPRDGQEALLYQSKQLESGYNKKFQQLAKDRERDAAFDGMVQEFQRNPNFAKHVMGFFEQQQAQQAQQQVDDPYGLGPRPDDPIEQLQYDAAVKAYQALEKKLGPQLKQREEQSRQMEHQMVVQRVLNDVRQDPLFDKVYGGIAEYIQSQPEMFRPGLYQQLDSDPRAFIETYNWVRQHVVGRMQQTPTKREEPQQQQQPRVEPRKEQAPILESSGADTREANEVSRAKKRDQARREAAKGNWQPFLKQAVESLGF